MKKYLFALLLPGFFFAGCSSNPYAPSNRFYKKQAKELARSLRDVPPLVTFAGKAAEFPVGTTNFNLRKPNYVIVHHTAQKSCEQTLKTFTLERTQVSAHYVICKDGTVHHMLNDYFRAWHGGAARWGSLTDINSASLGIELDNDGYESFPEPQINSLISLLMVLKKNYNIPTANFIGHADIAPGRKQDPNAFFPWQKLAENGFGYWPDMIVEPAPAGFNSLHALRMIGYDTRDSVAAIRAFKLHFIQTDLSPALTEADKGVLYDLIRKY